MAIYHMSMKAIGRSQGRSATGAAAYRAGEKIVDERTGLVHDYSRRRGVEHTELILPSGGSADRVEFWNRLEKHHKRGDAVLAREMVVALPAELDAAARQALVTEYARGLANQYKVAVDVAIHAPSKDGDERNHHAHMLLSACYVGPDGALGKKAVELDPIHCKRRQLVNVVEAERWGWEMVVNLYLERAGIESKIDRRSLVEQGTERVAQVHLGPNVVQMERRGLRTDRGERNRQANERNNQLKAVAGQIIDLDEKRKELAARKVLPDDLPSLEALWKPEIDKHLSAFHVKARRIVQKLDERIRMQARRMTEHDQREPHPPRVLSWLRQGTFFEKHARWEKMEKKIRFRWLDLKRLKQSVYELYISGSPHAWRAADKRVRQEKPELARKVDEARTKKREEDVQRLKDKMWQRQQEKGRERGGMGR